MTNQSKLTKAQVVANTRFADACKALTAAQDQYRLERTREKLEALLEAEQAARRAMWVDPVENIAPVTTHIDITKWKAAFKGVSDAIA